MTAPLPASEFAPDPDLLHLVENWYDLPDGIRRQIVELVRSWPQEERP